MEQFLRRVLGGAMERVGGYSPLDSGGGVCSFSDTMIDKEGIWPPHITFREMAEYLEALHVVYIYIYKV